MLINRKKKLQDKTPHSGMHCNKRVTFNTIFQSQVKSSIPGKKKQGIVLSFITYFFLLISLKMVKYTMLLWKLKLALDCIIIKCIFYRPILASWKFPANFHSITSTILKLEHCTGSDISFHPIKTINFPGMCGH